MCIRRSRGEATSFRLIAEHLGTGAGDDGRRGERNKENKKEEWEGNTNESLKI